MSMFFNTEDMENKNKLTNPEQIQEAFLYDEINSNPPEKIKEFCKAGGVGEQLVEEGKLTKKSFKKLSAKDNYNKLQVMVALQIAKEKDDPMFKKLVVQHKKTNAIKQAIAKKYLKESESITKRAYDIYLKKGRHGKGDLPEEFQNR